MKYDIIIPSWNMSEVAVKCLKSIQAYSTDYRVIFVDNGSEQAELDNILPVLEQMPHLLIRNEENLGFVKATNKGIEASEAPYLVLMNNDTEAVPGWLAKLSEPLEKNRNIMLSGPLTTTPNSWQGRYPKGKKGYAIRTNGMIAFFCTMFKREVFTKVGMLDERFGVGFGDDDDYCLRVLNAGYVMALVQDLVIPHHHRSTFKKIYGEANIKGMEVAAIDKFKEKHQLKTSEKPIIPGRNVTRINTDALIFTQAEKPYPDDPIDLVYVLGSGSKWGNMEMRYSLRSVEKNLSGYRNIYVVGDNPGFLTDQVIFIPYRDEIGPKNADGNMTRKILRACIEEGLSDWFLFMNDDFIINRPVKAAEVPWYHKGDMATFSPQYWSTELYRKRLRRTMEVLKGNGLSTLMYDYHAPMLMNKHDFPKVMAEFDYTADIGYTFRSLYGNCLKLPAARLNTQKKTIYTSYSPQELQKITAEPLFVGFNDRGLSSPFKMWLQKYFPSACTYEHPENKQLRGDEVKAWFNSGCDYKTGIEIFARHTIRNHKLVRYFRTRHDDLSEKRLKMTMKAWLH
jgi:GT2 family glycosyltransferase